MRPNNMIGVKYEEEIDLIHKKKAVQDTSALVTSIRTRLETWSQH